ncbi:hypothetical protein MYX78_05100 [Acidobacteria bacterium AH-259-G07]|nr:hypothetical protein [Acidobacteria bacterium AH-259-L09]MDA2926598.1 hypothetical protein [Acidobacteria bacterium AH-259-G07]
MDDSGITTDRIAITAQGILVEGKEGELTLQIPETEQTYRLSGEQAEKLKVEAQAGQSVWTSGVIFQAQEKKEKPSRSRVLEVTEYQIP